MAENQDSSKEPGDANQRNIPNEPSIKDSWDMYRELIRHEDGLVNTRLTWYLIVQGLLATGLINSFQMWNGSNQPALQSREWSIIHAIPVVLAVIGVLSSWMAMMSIWAALASIQDKVAEWDKLVESDKRYAPLACPDIIGGRMYIPSGPRGSLFKNTKHGLLFGLSWTSLPILGAAWVFFLLTWFLPLWAAVTALVVLVVSGVIAFVWIPPRLAALEESGRADTYTGRKARLKESLCLSFRTITKAIYGDTKRHRKKH